MAQNNDLFNQIVNISKASAYEILLEQRRVLKAENEKLRNLLKTSFEEYQKTGNISANCLAEYLTIKP